MLPVFDATWRAARRHQPYFCEENVWHLLHGDALPESAAALFVTNAARTVAMWGQRAARRDPIVWDYHVVALLPAHGLVVDLDDRTALARPVRDWLGHAFRAPERDLQPRFRWVGRSEFLAVFRSDRRHMLDGRGRALQPFPSWPAVGDPEAAHNLHRFLDLDDAIAGAVGDAAALLAAVDAAGRG